MTFIPAQDHHRVCSVDVVLFDAVGTLLRPEPHVAEAYHRAGARHGSRLALEVMTARFQAAFARSERQDAERGDGRTNEEHEQARWRQIVAEVFDDVDHQRSLFDHLWQHFAMPQHWRLFDDVAEVWSALEARGMRVAVASNFDSRLRSICQGLPPLLACSDLFISSELGYRKPHSRFFQAIELALGVPAEKLLLIGDTPENDYHAALAAGWQALLIDRQGRHDSIPVAHKMRSLAELAGCLKNRTARNQRF